MDESLSSIIVLIQLYSLLLGARSLAMENTNSNFGVTPPITRSIGFWMACAMAASQGLNAVRAFLDPRGFAAYMGIAFSAPELSAWVHVYGLRTGFIALIVLVFLLRRDLLPLKWMAICALFLPLGDAWIATQAGAPLAVVGRHVAIAVFLLLAAIMLTRDIAARAKAGRGR